MTDRELREFIIKNSFDLALRSYSLDAIRRVVIPP